MSLKYLLLFTLVFCILTLKNIRNTYELRTIVDQNEWVFLKVYSTNCGYCKEIEPICIELKKQHKNITFAELIGPQNNQFLIDYKITVFPTLFLFHGYADLPIVHHGSRDKKNLEGWIKYVTDFQLPTLKKINKPADVIYRGPRGKQYELVKILALRDIYTVFAWEQSSEQPVITVKGKNITTFTSKLEQQILKINAGLQNFTQRAWYNIHVKKMNGVVFVNHDSTKKLHQVLNKQAQNNPTIVFTHIEPNHEQYTQILDYLSASMQAGIYGLIPSRAGLFKLNKEMTAENIHQFVEGLKSQTLEIHKKSQKSDNPYVLTRNNQNLVKDIPKDIVLFLYDNNKPYTQKLFQLANYMIAYLQSNPNIHVFICNPLKNDLTIEVPVDPLPMIIFFKNNMKDHHIYFGESQINPDTVLNFIKENTTFDWVEPEEYGPSDEEEADQKKDQSQKRKDQEL